jgi:hypothetical protein
MKMNKYCSVVLSCGLQCRVVLRKPGYSEEHIGSIFRIEEYNKPSRSTQHAEQLVSCLAYSSTLKMEAILSSETSVEFYQTARRYASKDRSLHSHRCENLIANKIIVSY